MAAEDYFDSYDFDDDGDDDDPQVVTCRRCGKRNLEWVDCGTAGWKLYDSNKLHVCKNTASADEFEDVTQ